ncbi:SETMR methyltransferase, partial [Acromyrmex insinuator]
WKKNQFRAIKHLHIKDKTPKEIKAELNNIHSTSAPAFATVYNWVNEFSMIDMKKLSARWVPHLLTVDHKRDRVTISKQCLGIFQRNPDEFLHRFITMDETWIYYFTSGTKEQSKQWTSLSELLLNLMHVHTCPAPIAKFNEFHYELLPHPAYSPDLVPCDYFLFLKKWFRGKRFTTRELIAETEAYFEIFCFCYSKFQQNNLIDAIKIFLQNGIRYVLFCDVRYVGQTKRQLKIRLHEHVSDINISSKSPSVISNHRIEKNHNFKWDKVEILDVELSYNKKLISEMIHIKKQKHGINKQNDTESLPELYSDIIHSLSPS